MIHFLQSKIKNWWYNKTTCFQLLALVSLNCLVLKFEVFGLAFQVSIKTPFNFERGFFLWNGYQQPRFSNKGIEQSVEFFNDFATMLNVDWTMHNDHCGLVLEAGVLGVKYRYNLYDLRHWDFTEKQFQNGI